MRKEAVKDGREERGGRSGILEFAQDEREIRTGFILIFWDWFSCREALVLVLFK